MAKSDIKKSQKRKFPKYIRYRDRYTRYIRNILEIHSEGCVFEEKRCFETLFKRKKKPKYVRWKILMEILQRKGILKSYQK